MADASLAEQHSQQSRLLVLERSTESLVSKVSLSKDSLDNFLGSSPEIRGLQASAVKIEGVLVELRSLRSDVKEASTSCLRLDASTVKLVDFSDLRSRLASMTSLTDTVMNQSSSLSNLTEQLDALQREVCGSAKELTRTSGRTEECNSALAVLKGSVSCLLQAAEQVSSQHEQPAQQGLCLTSSGY